jgi:N4-gp56 family major capsid protein
MAVNTSAQFTADYEAIIADDLLPLTQNRLVVYHLGERITMPKGRGLQYTKVRFNRIPLPQAPLLEPTPAVAQTMQISEVVVSMQQWAGGIALSDVAQTVVKHDVLMKARELISIQAAETAERNTFNTLFGFTQVNTVNSRGSRGALLTGDVPGVFDLQRAQAQLSNLGAYKWDGTEDVNPRVDARQDADALSRRMPSPHYIVICHDFTAADLRMSPSFVQASQYSDVNKLYNSEFGQWAGDRVVTSNMVPFFVGVASIAGTAQASGGSLATGTYAIQVTELDPIRMYEQNIHQVTTGIAVTGPNGSITVVLPTSAFSYNIYISQPGSTTPINLATSPQGTAVGVLQGMAAGLAGGQTVTLTGIGVSQVPPPAPATGVTVYPMWVLGKYAFSQVVLDDIEINILDKPDKSDQYNQLRIVTWKMFYGTLLDNNLFAIRIEGASGFSTTFS